VQSTDFLERLVFPENQNHGKQADACGHNNKGENQGSA
jgi:hypothetical protein